MSPVPMTRTRIVAGLYLTDAAIVLLYLTNVWAGSPYLFPTRLLDLDGEANLPAWYSSAKFLMLGLVLVLVAHGTPGRLRSRRALLPSLLAFALSLDEVAGIHEWIGVKSDALLLGGDRVASLLPVTGSWMLVLAPVALAGAWIAFRALGPLLTVTPGARRLFLAGSAMLLAGALGAEVIANFVTPGTWHAALQVATEEGAELVGTTTLLWGSLELLSVTPEWHLLLPGAEAPR